MRGSSQVRSRCPRGVSKDASRSFPWLAESSGPALGTIEGEGEARELVPEAVQVWPAPPLVAMMCLVHFNSGMTFAVMKNHQ